MTNNFTIEFEGTLNRYPFPRKDLELGGSPQTEVQAELDNVMLLRLSKPVSGTMWLVIPGELDPSLVTMPGRNGSENADRNVRGLASQTIRIKRPPPIGSGPQLEHIRWHVPRKR
jgi:hypothetical protein